MGKLNYFDLLSPTPIPFYGVSISKPTLKEISEMGYSHYLRILKLFTLEDTDVAQIYHERSLPGPVPTPLQYLIQQSQNIAVFLEVQLGFITYIQKPVSIEKESFVVDLEGKNGIKKFVFNEENFKEFQEILLLINKIDLSEDEQEIVTDNEFMKQKFLEKRRKLKEAKKRQREKAALKGQGIGIPDMISCLCCGDTGYTMENIWNITIYQLYDQFDRFIKKMHYEHDYSAILAGADQNKIKIEDWIKIKS